MRRKSKILVVFSDNKTKNPLSKSSVGLFMLIKVCWKIGRLEPAQQAMWMHRLGRRCLKPDQQKAHSQTDCAQPLQSGQTFAEQQVTK